MQIGATRDQPTHRFVPMAAVLFVAVSFLFIPTPASAQEDARRVDVELGFGYALGGGLEDPGPTLPSAYAGVAVWITGRFGFAFAYVRGLGEDVFEPPEPLEEIGDRARVLKKDLRYFRASFRYKRRFPRALVDSIEFGGGLLFHARFKDIRARLTPAGIEMLTHGQVWGGFATELLITKHLGRHFGVKAGATFDFNFDTHFLNPVVVGVVSF